MMVMNARVLLSFYTGVWAGGNDLANEGSWVWGYPAVEAISYMNWGSGEPNSMG